MQVRAAVAEDAPGIGAVHVRSWQSAYRGLMPRDFLGGLDADRRGRGWAARLGKPLPPRESVLVGDVDGAVVGFAAAGPCRDEDSASAGEVWAIYLLEEWWGHGIGRELLAASIRALHAAGFAEAVLWVLDSNHRALRFYETSGWRPDGSTRQDLTFGIPLSEVPLPPQPALRRPAGSAPGGRLPPSAQLDRARMPQSRRR